MDKSSLGKRINTSRKERGLTSERLSELCNINSTYLRQIESGKKTPSLPVFVTICQQLNVTPTYLLLDTLNGTENGNIDDLIALFNTATPTQIKLISEMLKSALNTLHSE